MFRNKVNTQVQGQKSTQNKATKNRILNSKPTITGTFPLSLKEGNQQRKLQTEASYIRTKLQANQQTKRPQTESWTSTIEGSHPQLQHIMLFKADFLNFLLKHNRALITLLQNVFIMILFLFWEKSPISSSGHN